MEEEGDIEALLLQVGALLLSHSTVQYKDKQEVQDNGNAMSLPVNKRFHCFLTHKKEHRETEEWAVHVKDQLRHGGFEVFFDVSAIAPRWLT